MNRTTDELMHELFTKQDVQAYWQENAGELLCGTLAEYLNTLLQRHGLKKGPVIEAAQIERSYGYQLFSGRRGTPSREVLLSLALAMALPLAETQSLLRTAGQAMLYPRVRRDSIILHALGQGLSVMACNAKLERYGEAVLGE